MVVIDIHPRKIISAYTVDPFVKAKNDIEEAGFAIPTLQDVVRLRLQEGKYSEVIDDPDFVRESAVINRIATLQFVRAGLMKHESMNETLSILQIY